MGILSLFKSRSSASEGRTGIDADTEGRRSVLRAILVAPLAVGMAAAGCATAPKNQEKSADSSATPHEGAEGDDGSPKLKNVGDIPDKVSGKLGDIETPAEAARFIQQEIDRLECGSVHFEFNSAVPPRDIKDPATKIVAALKKFPTLTLQVQGHADERGTEEYNMALAENRAKEIVNLLKKLGAPSGSFVPAIGYGENSPVAEGSDDANWSKNRRGTLCVMVKGLTKQWCVYGTAGKALSCNPRETE